MKPTKETALYFTSRILGSYAIKMLKSKNVFQSIRAPNHIYEVGKEYDITLDGKFLYKVLLLSIMPFKLDEIYARDSLDGGFENEEELNAALKRAGFRFKPFSEYQANRIRFSYYAYMDQQMQEEKLKR